MIDIPDLKPKTEFVGKEPKTNKVKLKNRWWTAATDEEMGRSAFGVAEYIYQNQADRQQEYRAYQSLYSFREYSNTAANLGGMRSLISSKRTLSNKVVYNVVKSCVDTAAAKIASSRPRPMFLTTDGDWQLKKRAEKLTQYLDGTFNDLKLYEKGQQAFTDCSVYGTGCLKFYIRNNKIECDQVWVEDLLVDDAEAQYGSPRQLHQVRFMHREVLMEMFPDSAQLISTAASGDGMSSTQDMILVAESWHLPSGKLDAKKTDGVHIISIKEGTLFKADYRKDHFPFVFLRWTPRLRDFYGSGIAEELFGIQLEINRILKNIQIAMKRVAQPRVFLENGSKVIKSQITDMPGSIISYTGSRPVFETPTAMNSEVYNHLNTLYNKAFEIVGVSQLSASAKKQPGLESGVALREMSDIESERFLLVGQRLETFYMDAAKIIVDLSKDLYAQNPELRILVKSNKILNEIKWSDVDLPADKYIMQVYPTSLLPTTPGAKKQSVIELMQSDLIDKDIALDLLDFPDMKRAMSLRNAAVNDIMEVLEKIVEKGEYDSPEDYQNLQLCIQLGQQMYLRSKQDGVPEDRLELLRRFIDDSNELAHSKEAPAAPGAPAAPVQPAPGAQPIAQPMPQPESDMLPIK